MNFNLTIARGHDKNAGAGYGRTSQGHPVTGRTRGMTFPMYQYGEKEEVENIEDEDLDDEENTNWEPLQRPSSESIASGTEEEEEEGDDDLSDVEHAIADTTELRSNLKGKKIQF